MLLVFSNVTWKISLNSILLDKNQLIYQDYSVSFWKQVSEIVFTLKSLENENVKSNYGASKIIRPHKM